MNGGIFEEMVKMITLIRIGCDWSEIYRNTSPDNNSLSNSNILLVTVVITNRVKPYLGDRVKYIL